MKKLPVLWSLILITFVWSCVGSSNKKENTDEPEKQTLFNDTREGMMQLLESRMYRITSNIQSPDGKQESSKNSAILGYLLKKDYTEIEDFMCSFKEDHLVYKNEVYDVSGYYIDSMFISYKGYITLVYGDPFQALSEPNCTILTIKMAKRLFGDENPMMKVININDQDCVVKGVCKDLPVESKLNVDFLVSYPTLLKKLGFESFDKTGPENLWEFEVYTDIIIAEGFTIGEFVNNFSMDISSAGKGKGMLKLTSTPLSEID